MRCMRACAWPCMCLCVCVCVCVCTGTSQWFVTWSGAPTGPKSAFAMKMVKTLPSSEDNFFTFKKICPFRRFALVMVFTGANLHWKHNVFSLGKEFVHFGSLLPPFEHSLIFCPPVHQLRSARELDEGNMYLYLQNRDLNTGARREHIFWVRKGTYICVYWTEIWIQSTDICIEATDICVKRTQLSARTAGSFAARELKKEKNWK